MATNMNTPIAKIVHFTQNPNNEDKFTCYVRDEQDRELAICFMDREDMLQLQDNLAKTLFGIAAQEHTA